jgi:hypothetical protein
MANSISNTFTIEHESLVPFYIKVQGERFSIFKYTDYKSAPISHKSDLMNALHDIAVRLVHIECGKDKSIQVSDYVKRVSDKKQQMAENFAI